MSRKSLRRLIYECENLPDHGLTDEEVVRYAQQMMVGPGVSGQQRIKEAKVLVVGVGAEGSAVLVQLSAAGVGELGLVDPASISESDPAKEPVFAGAKMGAGKAESAKTMITDLNPLVTTNLYPISVMDLDHATVIPKYNVIVCCTDNAASRYYLNDLAVLYQKPMVLALASRTEGHCLVVNRMNGPCYRCLLPTPTGND